MVCDIILSIEYGNDRRRSILGQAFTSLCRGLIRNRVRIPGELVAVTEESAHIMSLRNREGVCGR